MKNRSYEGVLSLHTGHEGDTFLFLSGVKDCLAEHFSYLNNKFVTVRYWISDRQCTLDEAQETATKIVMGETDTRFFSRYSELTGYLWTDADFSVGGHDMLYELSSYVGKYLHMEIEYGSRGEPCQVK